MEMSSSETGLLMNRNTVMQSMQQIFGADDNRSVYKPVAISGADTGKSLMKKRGRPRKYGSISPPLNATAPAPAPATEDLQFTPVQAPATVRYVPSTTSPMRKRRGKPSALAKKMQQKQANINIGAGSGAAAGATGIGFTPHFLTVNEGEDVASRIMLFSQHGSRSVCILSATGGISNVTLRQPEKSGGTVTYEGRFELLSLSGSFMLAENTGIRSMTGGLSAVLAGPNGSVLGGGVAGLLTAATPVQVVACSFMAEERQEPRLNHQMEPFPGIRDYVSGMGLKRPRSPSLHGAPSETSGGGRTPMNYQTMGACTDKIPLRGIPWK